MLTAKIFKQTVETLNSRSTPLNHLDRSLNAKLLFLNKADVGLGHWAVLKVPYKYTI